VIYTFPVLIALLVHLFVVKRTNKSCSNFVIYSRPFEPLIGQKFITQILHIVLVFSIIIALYIYYMTDWILGLGKTESYNVGFSGQF